MTEEWPGTHAAAPLARNSDMGKTMRKTSKSPGPRHEDRQTGDTGMAGYMNFKDRGYCTEFGYGAYKHDSQDELLILDTGVFGPNCEDGQGRYFRFKAPDGTDMSCTNIYGAMAAYLSDYIGRNVKPENQDIETATRQAIDADENAEENLRGMMSSLVKFWLGLNCDWGHKAIEDLADTAGMKLTLDIPYDEMAGTDIEPYWGTIHDGMTGKLSGKNMFGHILEHIRNDACSGWNTDRIFEQGYMIYRY